MLNYFKEKYKKIILIAVFAMNILFSFLVFGNVYKRIGFSALLLIPLILETTDIVLCTIGGLRTIANKYKKYRFYIFSAILSLLALILGGIFAISNGGYVFLLIVKMLMSLGAMVFYYVFAKELNVDLEEEDSNLNPIHHDYNDWVTLITDIILNICLIVLFVTPFYKDSNGDVLLINSLIKPATDLLPSIAAFVFFVLWIISFINLSNVISIFAVGKKEFAKLSKQNALLVLGITLAFSASGYIIALVNSLAFATQTVSSTLFPVIVIGLISILHSIFVARCGYLGEEDKVSNKTKFQKALILFFILLFTACTIACLFLNIVNIDFLDNSGNVAQTINITGKDLLQNYSTMEKGFRLMAFVILIFLFTSAALAIENVVAFCSRSKYYKALALITVVLNCIFVFFVGLFGAYYKIINEIDKVTLESIINTYGFSVSSFIDLETAVTSESFYLLVVDACLGLVLFILKPFTKYDLEDAGVFKIKNMGNDETVSKPNTNPDEQSPVTVHLDNDMFSDENGEIDEETIQEENQSDDIKQDSVIEENQEEVPEEIKEAEEVKIPDFDACPAFSEIDENKEKYDEALSDREEWTFVNPTLPSLVKFVVDYARESRLHLSYTYEDIATFIAGLGTTRLQILQGMSGTGKTSLPKIFLEALMGNTEIVEVESSWKDKNELLGYYNEFSKVYTPKKFTQALYKASLNPEVMTFIVLDEMNLSRIEYYFSDFLSLMENEEDKREIKLLNVKLYNTYDGEKHSYLGLTNDHTIKIPTNVWFIGTANRDESTFEISDKVYDRAYTINFNKRAPKIKNFLSPLSQNYISYPVFRNLINEATENFKFDLDDYEVVASVEKLLQPYNISFGNRVERQMENFVKIYCSCFNNPTELIDEALEKILLSKVVSKLEFKAIENKEELVREFEKLKLYSCSEFISKLNEDF